MSSLSAINSAYMNAGMVMMFAGSNAPSGWLLCNGASYSRTDPLYVKLFQVIGTTYGGTASTFNVPDLRDRVVRGQNNNLGSYVGANSISLSEANIPSHSHTLSVSTTTDGSHSHTCNSTSISHTHTFSASGTSGAGGGHAHAFTTGYTSDAGQGQKGFGLTGNGGWTNLPLGNTNSVANHTHSIALSGTTGAADPSHSHTIAADGSHFHTVSGTTSSVGSGTSISIIPACCCINYIIKL